MTDRKKQAFYNVNAGFINRITHLVFQFLIRTVMIRTLGAEFLGLSSIFTSILQVLSVAELGFGNAVVFSMYKPFAEKNIKKICALLNYYRKVYYILGTIILVVELSLTPFLHLFIQSGCPDSVNLYVLYFIYLANTVMGYFLFAYKMCLFIADQRDYIQSNIKTIISLIMYICQIIVLIVLHNYYIYIILLPLSTVLINIIQEICSKKDYSDIKCVGKLNRTDKKELKKQVVGLLSYKIGGVVYENSDIVVISSFLGLVPLAIYTNYYYVISGLNAIFAIVQSAMTSTVGNGVVTDSLNDNVNRFSLLTNLYDWIIGLAFIFCVCFFQPFMTVWMGPEHLLPNTTMIMLCFYFYIYNFQPAVSIYKNAAGIWWQDKIRPVLSAVANIVLNIILVRILGIDGVILASIITGLFINIPFSAYFLFKNYLNISFKKYIFRKIFVMFLTSIICAITIIICAHINVNNIILTLLIRGIICIIVPNLLFVIVFRITGDLKVMKNFINDLTYRIKKERN